MPISKASRRRGATLAITAALAAFAGAAFYLPGLDTGFASEDFLVLAHLSRESVLDTLRHEVSSPWLGLAPVGFWRPVSTVLLALELRLFGLHPARFHAAHLALHAFNAWLVAMIVTLIVGGQRRARDLRDQPLETDDAGAVWIAAVSAALFAVHPFHPSAMLFIGAFATLFGAAFSLLAIYCFLAARRLRCDARALARRLDLAAILFFALALGSYEAAAVVPVVLLVTTILLPGAISARVDGRGRAASLPARALSFPSSSSRLSISRSACSCSERRSAATPRSVRGSSPPRSSARRDLVAALGRILHPHYGLDARRRGSGGSGRCRASPRSSSRLDRRRAGRAALAGLAWVALFLAPFAFVGLVPANGRYAYLAIAGVVLAIGGLGGAFAARWPRLGAIAILAASIAVAADWIGPLRHTLAAYDRARALVAAVRSDVLGVAAEHGGEGTSRAGRGRAGLRQGRRSRTDRQGVPVRPRRVGSPPVRSAGARAHPTAGVAERIVQSRARRPAGHRSVSLGLRRRTTDAGRGGRGAATDARVGPFDPVAGRLAASCATLRLDASRRPHLRAPVRVPPLEATAGRATFAVSSDFLRGLDGLGPGPAFFWVEEVGDGGANAMSAIARFDVGVDAAESFAEAAAKIRRDSGDDDEPGLERIP